jgi:hypothetical protein
MHAWTWKSTTAALLLSVVGCATYVRHPVPLALPRLERLAKNAQAPAALGLETRETDNGIAFGNTHSIPLGSRGSISFSGRLTGRNTRIPIIEARINDRLVAALIDTAMSESLVDYSTAVRTDIRPVSVSRFRSGQSSGFLRRFATAPVGAVGYITSYARSVGLGNLRVYNVLMGVIDDRRGTDALQWIQHPHVEAILGDRFLRSFARVTIDFPGETVRFDTTGAYRPDPRKLVGAAQFDPRARLPAVRGVLDKRLAFPVVLNSGGDYGLLLPRRIGRELKIDERIPQAAFQEAMRENPRLPLIDLGEKTIDLSGFDLEHVPTVLSAEPETANDASYALLGHKVLRRFKVTIDYGAGVIYFEEPDNANR